MEQFFENNWWWMLIIVAVVIIALVVALILLDRHDKKIMKDFQEKVLAVDSVAQEEQPKQVKATETKVATKTVAKKT